MSWTWIYQNEDGSPTLELPAVATLDSFPTRDEAEAYIGEKFQELLDGGVQAVTLYENEVEVFGPMSLSPA